MSAMTREEELWEKLADEAGEELIEQAAATSVADAEAELRAGGFDVAEERARAEAFLAWLERGSKKPAAAGSSKELVAQAVAQEPDAEMRSARRERDARGTGRRSPTRRPVAWAATAAALAAGAVGAYVATRPGETPVAKPTPSSPPTAPEATAPPTRAPAVFAPDLAGAAALRRQAAAAYASKDYMKCLRLLEQARDEDPDGDATPEMRSLREKARDALEAKQK